MASILYGAAGHPERDPRDVLSTITVVDDTTAEMDHSPEEMGAAFDRDAVTGGGLTTHGQASYVDPASLIDNEYPSLDLATGQYGQDVYARQPKVGSFLDRLKRGGPRRLAILVGIEPTPLGQYGYEYFSADKRPAQADVRAQIEAVPIPSDSARVNASTAARQSRAARAAAYADYFGITR